MGKSKEETLSIGSALTSYKVEILAVKLETLAETILAS